MDGNDGTAAAVAALAAGDPYGYKGKYGYYAEPGIGLILCTNRYYDSATGRWLTRDPIGYDGGMNLYAYCGDDSTIRLWDIYTYDCLAIFPTSHPVRSLSSIYKHGNFICGTENGPAYELQIANLSGIEDNTNLIVLETKLERNDEMSLKKLFLSYHHDDVKAVEYIESALRFRGIVPWMDKRSGFFFADPVANEVKRVIREDCFGFLLYASEGAFSSNFIQKEEMFEARHKKEQDANYMLVAVPYKMSFEDLRRRCDQRFQIDLSAYYAPHIEGMSRGKAAEFIAKIVLKGVVVKQAMQPPHDTNPSIQFSTFPPAPDIEGDLLRIDASREFDDPKTRSTAKLNSAIWERLLNSLFDVAIIIAEKMGYRRLSLRGKSLMTGAFMFGRVFAYFPLDISGESEVWQSDAKTIIDDLLDVNVRADDPETTQLFVELSCTTQSVKKGADALALSNQYGNPIRLQLALPNKSIRMNEAICRAAVNQVHREVQRICAQHDITKIHLLAAVPFAMMVMLGHKFTAMPPVQCYEWDADDSRYKESFIVPGRQF